MQLNAIIYTRLRLFSSNQINPMSTSLMLAVWSCDNEIPVVPEPTCLSDFKNMTSYAI